MFTNNSGYKYNVDSKYYVSLPVSLRKTKGLKTKMTRVVHRPFKRSMGGNQQPVITMYTTYVILSSYNFWILCEINFTFFDFYTAFARIGNILSNRWFYVLMIGVFQKRG